MEWSLEAIASSLQLAFEEGYDDRYTFTLTDNKLSVDDLHLMVNVCTIEPYGEGYILHPHEETVDAIVLDGTSESPWLLANQFVDIYDTEHPVSREQYVVYLESISIIADIGGLMNNVSLTNAGGMELA